MLNLICKYRSGEDILVEDLKTLAVRFCEDLESATSYKKQTHVKLETFAKGLNFT